MRSIRLGLLSLASGLLLVSEAMSAASTVNVTVPFLTDRSIEAQGAAAGYYGSDHAPLSAGHCDTQIDNRRPKRLGKVTGVRPTQPGQLTEAFSNQQGEPLVIYVHGFGENFIKACRRASLLQHQLDLAGRMLLFSWPSSGNLLDYWGDAARMTRSVPTLRNVLVDSMRTNGPHPPIIIAHSMGARAVMKALEPLEGHKPGNATPVLGPLVLVAPDIERSTFEQRVGPLSKRVSSLTLYVSRNDRVLRLSQLVNLSSRLGHGIFDRDMVGWGAGLSQIDVSATPRGNFGGHVYHLFNDAVVEDLKRQLGTSADAPNRFIRRPTSQGWELVPSP